MEFPYTLERRMSTDPTKGERTFALFPGVERDLLIAVLSMHMDIRGDQQKITHGTWLANARQIEDLGGVTAVRFPQGMTEEDIHHTVASVVKLLQRYAEEVRVILPGILKEMTGDQN